MPKTYNKNPDFRISANKKIAKRQKPRLNHLFDPAFIVGTFKVFR